MTSRCWARPSWTRRQSADPNWMFASCSTSILSAPRSSSSPSSAVRQQETCDSDMMWSRDDNFCAMSPRCSDPCKFAPSRPSTTRRRDSFAKQPNYPDECYQQSISRLLIPDLVLMIWNGIWKEKKKVDKEGKYIIWKRITMKWIGMDFNIVMCVSLLSLEFVRWLYAPGDVVVRDGSLKSILWSTRFPTFHIQWKSRMVFSRNESFPHTRIYMAKKQKPHTSITYTLTFHAYCAPSQTSSSYPWDRSLARGWRWVVWWDCSRWRKLAGQMSVARQTPFPCDEQWTFSQHE